MSLTAEAPTQQNGQTNLNNSSAVGLALEGLKKIMHNFLVSYWNTINLIMMLNSPANATTVKFGMLNGRLLRLRNPSKPIP